MSLHNAPGMFSILNGMIIRILRIALAVLCPLLASPRAIGAEAEDSICSAEKNGNILEQKEYKFNPHDLILPGALITVGIAGYYLDGFYGFNKDTHNSMTQLRGERYFHLDDYVQYLPVAGYLTLEFAGIKGGCSFKERVAIAATAYLTMSALTNIGKYTFREKRPDSEARNSFPSGHTATAFTGAELMRIEYGTWPGLVAYTVATVVSFLRMYNGRHWLNDVIAGAGIGILSARIGYWMLPLYRKWFGWDKPRKSSSLIVAPGYDPVGQRCAVALQYTF